MLLLCIFKQFFCATGGRYTGGGQISNVKSTYKSMGTMSLDGSPKAKAVYEKSSKILFKQKWSIPKVYSFTFSPFLAGPNLPSLKAQN